MLSTSRAPRLRAFTGALVFGLVLVGLYNGVRLCGEVVRLLGGAGDGKRWTVLAIVAAAAMLGFGALALEARDWRRGAYVLGLPALLRKAFVALVLAWLWTVFPQPALYPFPIARLTFAVAAGAFGAAYLASAAVSTRWSERARRSLDVAVFSLCLTAVLGEFSLRVLASISPSPLLARLDASLEEQMQFFRLQPGQLHHGFRANPDGHNDAPFLSERTRARRVACVGDSFSVGVVPRPWHYAELVEAQLEDTEVMNFGIPGIGPAQYLELIRREVLAYEPDRVVLTLFAGNDLELEPQDPDPARRWQRVLFDRRNVLLWLIPERLRVLARERARGADAAGPEPGPEASFEGLAREAIVARAPWLEDPSLEPPEYSSEQFLSIEAERALLACAGSDEDYAELFAVLERIQETLGEVPLAVMLIPDEFQVDDELWEELVWRLAGTELERDRFQLRVGAWLDAHGVPKLDLLPVLRAVPALADGKRHVYHLRDTHFNARGNRIAAEALAEFLRD